MRKGKKRFGFWMYRRHNMRGGEGGRKGREGERRERRSEDSSW